MIKTFSFLILLLILGNDLYAQFTDSTHYYLGISTTGIYNRTNNTASYVITNGASYKINKENFVFNSSVHYIYGEQQKRLTNNDVTVGVDFNWYRNGNKTFYYWGLANYDRSFSLNLNHRTQSGLGVAYSIVDKKDAYLNISDGLLYEYVDLQLPDSTNDIYSTVRNSFRLQFRLALYNLFVIDGSSFLQNSLRDGSDYIIRSNTNFSFKLNKWLSLTAAATYNHLSRTNRETLLLTFGAKAETYLKSMKLPGRKVVP